MSAPRSIAARVALGVALAIACAGLAVGAVGLAMTELFGRSVEDTRLRDAALIFATELAEADADPATVAEDEGRELAHTGMLVAVFAREGGALLGGHAEVPHLAAGTCTETHGLRACAVAHGPWLAVAARAVESRQELRSVTALALALAVLLTTLVGTLLARTMARLALAPFLALTDDVAAIDPQRPSSERIARPTGVAEIDHLRAVLTATLDRLAASLDHARRFAGDAAHELRTPLTAIRGELDLVRERLEQQGDEPETLADLARAARTVERLGHLVERLLVLAHPDDEVLTHASFEAVDAVEDLVALRPAADRERIRLEHPTRPIVSGDASLFAAMVSAALDNALAYSRDAVVVRFGEQDGGLVLDIDDEGPGVPAADRERVFAPFERAADARGHRPAGHGLGLSLVAHVARRHGGAAAFVDKARGARLRITLPAPLAR